MESEDKRGPYTNFGRSTGPDVARRMVKTVSGALATVYSCPCCNHFLVMRKGRIGVGRGYGLRMGGTLTAQMGAHIRQMHPDAVARERAKLGLLPKL